PTVTPTDPSKWGTHYRNDQIRQLMRKMLDNGVARNTCVADFRLRHHEYTEAVVSEKVLGNMLREICPLEEKIVHKTHRAVKGTKDVDMYKSRPGATADELGMSEDQHAAVKRFVDGEKRKKAHFEALNHGVPSTGSTGVLGAGPRRKALPKATYHKVGDDDSITRNMRENTHLSQEQFCKKFEVSKSQYLRRVKFMSTAVEIAPTPTRAADLTQASTSTSVASNVNTNRPGNQNKFPPFPAFPIILDNVWPPVTPMFNTTDASSRPSLNPSLPYLPPAPRAALAVRTEPGPMPMPNPPGYHSPRS
ncbi:MAG: hypothetical protein JWP52_1027, partial [Rhizobacter sp.]|nr:hypothetical protein [Rhizobacter sp.]